VSEAVRSFVAVDPPEEVREAVGRFLAQAAGLRGVKWVGPGQMHFTLAFLGGVDTGRLPGVAAALDAALAARPAFRLALTGAGAFPSVERPRVLWVGAGEGAGELAALAGLVEQALEPLGFPAPDRPFAPHLTVGRVKERLRDPGPLRRLVDAARGRVIGEFLVPAVRLQRSDLFPSGPRYTILHETRLAGATRGASRQGSEQ